ncbi:MAG: M48 family metalloprotease [Gammaproteobacteria bacterium]|nr:M48 family metalloprotease [Gammaproteobacteria bacterium]
MRKETHLTIRRLLPLSLLLGLFTLSACVKDLDLERIDLGQVLNTAQQAFGEVDVQQETLIGEEAVSVLLGAVPLLENDPLQRYVNQVGHWVALHTERSDLAWKFAVLDSPDINAFAAPGGYILITKGLLLKLQSEAELAGVLAHETVHVVRKHHLAAVQQGARLDLAVQLGRAGVDEKHEETMEKLSRGFKELYARGLDKNDEFEADRMGVVIAARAGYDPYGLPAVLQTLAGMSPDDTSLAFLFSTHPAPARRLSLLERLYDRLDPYARQPQLQQRFEQQIASLRSRS